MENLTHVVFWQIAAGVATVITAISILIPKMRKAVIKPLCRYVVLCFKAPSALEDIQRQVKPNGGTSLCDSVNQLKVQMAKVEASLNARSLLEKEARFWSNTKGETVGVNNAYYRLFQCSHHDIEGFNFKRLLDQEDAVSYLQDWLSCVELGCDFIREIHGRNIKGEDIGLLSVHAVPLKGLNNEIIGFEGVIHSLKE